MATAPTKLMTDAQLEMAASQEIAAALPHLRLAMKSLAPQTAGGNDCLPYYAHLCDHVEEMEVVRDRLRELAKGQ